MENSTQDMIRSKINGQLVGILEANPNASAGTIEFWRTLLYMGANVVSMELDGSSPFPVPE